VIATVTAILAAIMTAFAYRRAFTSRSTEIRTIGAIFGGWTFAALWFLLMLATALITAS